MIKELRYILWSIVVSIGHDIAQIYLSLSKPREVIKYLFYILVMQLIVGKLWQVPITLFFMFIAYITKIVKQGDWRHNIRKDYKMT
jgi:hypothetical protein